MDRFKLTNYATSNDQRTLQDNEGELHGLVLDSYQAKKLCSFLNKHFPLLPVEEKEESPAIVIDQHLTETGRFSNEQKDRSERPHKAPIVSAGYPLSRPQIKKYLMARNRNLNVHIPAFNIRDKTKQFEIMMHNLLLTERDVLVVTRAGYRQASPDSQLMRNYLVFMTNNNVIIARKTGWDVAQDMVDYMKDIIRTERSRRRHADENYELA